MTGAGLKDTVLVILGNIFIIILAARAVGYYAKREWGEMITHVVGGIFVAAVVYFPDDVVKFLKAMWSAFSGSGS